MKLHIEFFSGYGIGNGGNGASSHAPVRTDVHVCDERGRTVKVFPSRTHGSRKLSERIAEAEEWIAVHSA